MQAAWLNRAQVWATTGRPATSSKSLSTFGPMRVPLPAATMMALFTGLQVAGCRWPRQARLGMRQACGERWVVAQIQSISICPNRRRPREPLVLLVVLDLLMVSAG